MSTRFEPLPTRKRFQVPLRRSLEIGVLILMLIALQLIEPLSRLWVRDVISQNAADQQLSLYADEIVIHALMARRFEKDILLNLDNPAERERYLGRWNTSLADLEQAIAGFHGTAVLASDQNLAGTWQTNVNAYRIVMSQMLQAINTGAIVSPTEANRLLDPGKRPIREVTNSALAVAEKKELATQASSDEMRRNLATSARVIVLALMAGLLFTTFRTRG